MKLFFAILAGIIIGGGAGLGIFYHHEITNFRAAAWKYPPIVVDCTFGAIEEKRINDAIKFWDNIDHKIGFVEMNPSSETCMNDQIHGFIIIKNAELEWPTIGKTYRKGSRLGIVDSALIHLSIGGANLPKLLEHELGHAFGYNHLDIDGHIMNSNYDYSGYNFWD
tara:strand:- start:237 stop:734 length:498 start_codon:yes stop_codon:yes gene_type:complete